MLIIFQHFHREIKFGQIEIGNETWLFLFGYFIAKRIFVT